MDALAMYLAKLQSSHKQVKTRWEEFEIASTAGNSQDAMARAATLTESLIKLAALLTSETAPEWLNDMLSDANRLAKSEVWPADNIRPRLIRDLRSQSEAMLAYTFGDQSINPENSTPLLNIDEVVEMHFSADRLDELYESAVRQIEEALDLGIDSKKVTADLERILAMLKGVQGTSFVNQRYQVPILQRYLRAAAKVAAKKLPVIGFVSEVIDEANKELEVSNEDILRELQRQSDQRAIEFGVLIEHQSPDALPPLPAPPDCDTDN